MYRNAAVVFPKGKVDDVSNQKNVAFVLPNKAVA